MNRSFLRILAASAITVFLISVVTVVGFSTQSSLRLLTGGVKTFPQATAFVPKQAPAMVSLLANPEQLYGIRQVNLPLKQRHGDRTEWLKWTTSIFSNTGLNYQSDLQPWLGDELTFAITALDFDRNHDNGIQPGYLLVTEAKNTQLATASLKNLYSQQHDISLEQYKGANVMAQSLGKNQMKPDVWANAIVGNFVLFANHPQILKEAINQAQAINLNLQQSDNYQDAIALIAKPHIAVIYLDVPKTSAWLDKFAEVTQPHNNQTLSAAFSISNKNLAIETSLPGVTDVELSKKIYKSLIHNPELKQFFDVISLEDNSYIDLTPKASLSPNQLPDYEVSRLAIKSMFPHLDAIAIKTNYDENEPNRAHILLKLDNYHS